jgi:thiamine pyrophosphate-dependent acetolactate synthase large subunit-like protein
MSKPATDPHSTTAARILQVLADAGVTTVFGLPGAHNLSFWRGGGQDDQGLDVIGVDGAPTASVRIVGVRHEQTAAFAADGLARATGGLGVALVTSGPGAANTLAAFGEAAASGSPVLVIASDVPEGPRNRHGRSTRPGALLHESRDQGAMFSPLAKAVLQPTDPEAAVEAAVLAVQTALEHPRGPVYLGVPSDVLAAPAGLGEPVTLAEPPAASPNAITAAADLLNRSDRPLVWVGGGVATADAGQTVTDLAWRLGAPVVTSFAGRGVLPPAHPLLVDAPPHEPAVVELIGQGDALLSFGTAFDGMTTRNGALSLPAQHIDVNLAPSDSYEPTLSLVGDVGQVADALAVRLAPRDPWADAPYDIAGTVRRGLAQDPLTASVLPLLEAVDEWPDHGVVVCDMAVAGYWVGGYAQMARPRRLQYPVGWGTLGFGLPAAIGAAQRGDPVLAVVGDGGLAMALGELATLTQERLPVTVLVVDDEGYGMLRFDQDRDGDLHRGVDLVGPNWLTLAQAFGLAAAKVDAASLALALAAASRGAAPSLLWWPVALYPPRTTSPRWVDRSPA